MRRLAAVAVGCALSSAATIFCRTGFPKRSILRAGKKRGWLDILADGIVTLCCMDQDGEFSWGDVNKQSRVEWDAGGRAGKSPARFCDKFAEIRSLNLRA
jgi:hypothetical protein